MRGPRRLGFTLIELLVVIAIIALLIGILLPSLGTARDTAKALKCGTQLKQQGAGLSSYQGDNNGWTPPGHRQINQSSPWAFVWWTMIRKQIDSDNQHMGIFNCPSAPEDRWWEPEFNPNDPYVTFARGAQNELVRHYGYRENEVPVKGNGAGEREGHYFTYGYNELGSSDYFALGGVNPKPLYSHGLGVHAWLPKDGTRGMAGEPRGWGGTPEDRIVFPAQMIAIADATQTAYDDPWIQPNRDREPDGSLWFTNPSARHAGNSEVLWMDGHVSMERHSELTARTFEARSMWNNTHRPHDNLWPDSPDL